MAQSNKNIKYGLYHYVNLLYKLWSFISISKIKLLLYIGTIFIINSVFLSNPNYAIPYLSSSDSEYKPLSDSISQDVRQQSPLESKTTEEAVPQHIQNPNILTLKNHGQIVNSKINVEEYKNNIYEEYEFVDENKPIQPTIIRSDLIIPTELVLLERPDMINKIHNILENGDNEIQTIALVGILGIGGVGKTTLARYYARIKSDASVIFEMNAETKESIMNSYRNLAYFFAKTSELREELNFIEQIQNLDTRENQLLSFIKSQLRESTNWLLIYDNVEDLAQIHPLLPHNSKQWGNGKVIITTRNQHIADSSYVEPQNILQVDGLSTQETLALFTKILYDKAPSQLSQSLIEKSMRFLKHLPPFPLDVSIAAHYLKMTNASFDKYLEYLREDSAEFETTQNAILHEVGDYTKTRHNIIALALKDCLAGREYCAEGSKVFNILLLLISLVDSQNIPRDLLDRYGSREEVNNFIFNLQKYSLITSKNHESLPRAFSIHRSVQEIMLSCIKQTADLKHDKKFLTEVTNRLYDHLNNALDSEDSLQCRVLLIHGEAFLGHQDLLKNEAKGMVSSVLGSIYYYLGYHNLKTKQLLSESLDSLNKSSKEHSEAAALALTHLGAVYRSLGEDRKAIKFLEDSIAIYKQHNKKHIGTARAMVYLGNIDRILGYYKRAKELLEGSVNIYNKYKTDHIGAARAMGYLGVLYRDLGDFIKARDILTQGLAIYDKTPEHTNRPFIMTYLGNIYRELGEYSKAQKVLESSVDIYKNYHLKNKIPPYNVGWSLSHLAIVHYEIGDYKKAQDLLQESFSIYKQHYSGQEEHPNIAWILVNLGDVERALGNHEKAIAMLEQSMVINSNHYFEYHIDIGWNLLHAGHAYKDHGWYTKAKASLEKSLVIYKQHYGERHIQTARILHCLGDVLTLEGKNLGDAEKFLLNSLEIFNYENHPDAYKALESLSALYLKESTNEEKTQEPLSLIKQAFDYLNYAQKIMHAYFPIQSMHHKRIQDKMVKLELLIQDKTA